MRDLFGFLLTWAIGGYASSLVFGFSLTKWYLDLVTDQGDAVICYSARLSVGFVSYQASALLEYPGDGSPAREVYSTKEGPEPRATAQGLHWSCPALGVSGDWDRLAPDPGSRTLGPARGNQVQWHAQVPRGSVRIQLPGQRTLQGLGYAEKLTLNTPPWKLPIQDLFWGRHLTPEGSLIWIRWTGGHPLSLVLRDGVEIAGGQVTEEEVRAGDLILPLPRDQRRVLREGSLGEEALRHVPAPFRSLIPASATRAREAKWLQQTPLKTGSQSQLGWALYEKVELGNP